jgi:hypothetical protein
MLFARLGRRNDDFAALCENADVRVLMAVRDPLDHVLPTRKER